MSGGYEVAYLQRDQCGSDIVTFRFERPSGYTFAAGQWFTLRLQTAEGPGTHTFSHSSAPGDDYLELTTRLSPSAYKRALGALEPGAIVHLNGPGGRLSVAEDVTRVAFLAGGVGVTPIRSILRDAAARGRRFDDALLLYGNRDESCVPFLAEFQAMADIGVRVVVVYERPTPEWPGESGFITADTVRRHLDVSDGRQIFVTGPPVMVSAIENVLDQLGVDAGRRRIERFASTA
jgi:ferredoxin-NADP reductase